jgi:16S rRNA (adenine1518-N6/adenine1519-N6)-dimethyltransferase
MVAVLRAEQRELELREENALQIDLPAIAAGAGAGPVVVVGNLPYQIGSPILLRVLAQHSAVVRVVVMLQREVAERVVAAPDTEAYGALSVLCQTFAQANIVRRVPPSAFLPPPKVESAVVRLSPSPPSPALIPDMPRYRGIVDAAFQMRRKTLRNALRKLVDAAGFEAAGIDSQRRGETLSVMEFAALARTPPAGSAG